MAIPALWRASDDFLISDKPIIDGQSGVFEETSGVQENELLIGGIYHMEQLGNPHEETSITFIMAANKPTSSLTNLAVLKECRRKIRQVKFRDINGTIHLCEIVTDLKVTPRGNRLIESNNVTVNLRKAGAI